MEVTYRAADDPNIIAGDCVTDDVEIARSYAQQRRYRHVYVVNVSSKGEWATEKDVRRVREELTRASYEYDDDGYEIMVKPPILEPFSYEGYMETWGDLDQEVVRQALAAEGFVAVQFEEPWGDERGSHWTLRILDPAIVESVELERCEKERYANAKVASEIPYDFTGRVSEVTSEMVYAKVGSQMVAIERGAFTAEPEVKGLVVVERDEHGAQHGFTERQMNEREAAQEKTLEQGAEIGV